MPDDGDESRKRFHIGSCGAAEIDAPGVCAQMRFVMQNATQRVHERWSEDRDVTEKEFACDEVPELAS